MDDEGMLNGYTEGTWHCHGHNWLGTTENTTGTWAVDVNFSIAVSGAVETAAEGRILHLTLVPTILSLENWVIVDDQQTDAHVQDNVTASMPGWLNAYFVPLDLPAVDSGPLSATVLAADGTEGSATLTALWDEEDTFVP
jgi:hypothetical protein